MNLRDKRGVDVYVALMPSGECDLPLYPEERDRVVRETGNDIVRRERYFAWRLLELGIRDSLGLELPDIGLRREGARWTSDAVDISLSHSGGALAVAISREPVGVDIEPLDGGDAVGVAERFFNGSERELYYSAPKSERREVFLRIWTAKEAIFKSQGGEAFSPLNTDSSGSGVYTERIHLGERNYILSVASPCEIAVHIAEL